MGPTIDVNWESGEAKEKADCPCRENLCRSPLFVQPFRSDGNQRNRHYSAVSAIVAGCASETVLDATSVAGHW